MSTLKRLAGDAALYGLSSILGRLLNYLLVAYYTRVFLPAEYGIITELYAYVAFLNVVFTFGMETTFFRFAGKNSEDAGVWFSRTISILLIIGGLLTALIYFNAGYLEGYFEHPKSAIYIKWLSITMLIDALLSIPFAYLRLMRKTKKFVAIKLGNIGLSIVLNLFFLSFLRESSPTLFGSLSPEAAGYVFLANLLANALQIPFFFRELKSFRFMLDKGTATTMFKYSWPIMVMGMAGMVDEMMGRALLKRLLPAGFYHVRSAQEALGIYGACYKLSVFMALAIQAFRYAADPFFFSRAKDKNAPELFAKVMLFFTWVCMLIFLGVSVNLFWIAPMFLGNGAYLEALEVVPILLLAGMFLGIYYNLSVWFKLTDRTIFGTYLSFAGALITVLGNIALIPILGYLGSSITTLLCYMGMSALSYSFGNKYFPVPYDLSRILSLVITGVALFYGYELLTIDASITTKILTELLTIGIFGLVSYLILKPELNSLKRT